VRWNLLIYESHNLNVRIDGLPLRPPRVRRWFLARFGCKGHKKENRASLEGGAITTSTPASTGRTVGPRKPQRELGHG